MKNAVKVIFNVLAWVVLILALLITMIVFSSERNNGVANLFGFIPLTVESDSMKPTFSQGDLIFCREVDDVNSLAEGDVITFWTIIDGKRVKNTHRIVGINQAENSRSFVTRGDNNPIDDTMPAYAGDIIGKWTEMKIGGMGKAMGFLRTKTGFFVCIIIPMAIFFLFELYKFIMTLIEVKRPAAEVLDEEEIKRRAVEEYLAAQKEKEAADKPAGTADTAEKKTAEPAVTAEAPAEKPAEPTPAEKPAEPAPAETPAEPTPAEKPAEPAPAEKPAEPAPAETPAEPAPAETPAEPAPAETPAEPAPAETPAEPAPAEKPAEPAPADETPAENAGGSGKNESSDG